VQRRPGGAMLAASLGVYAEPDVLPASLRGAMPRYYFDVSDGDKFTRDDEGLEMGDLIEASKAAVAALPEIARDVLPDGDHRDIIVQVRDQTGEVLIRSKLTLDVEWLGERAKRAQD
jgi:hypothetical protein